MICSQCKDPGVLNHANGKPFYYCRTCKIEIVLEQVKKSEPEYGIQPTGDFKLYPDSNRSLTQEEIDAMFEWYYNNGAI